MKITFIRPNMINARQSDAMEPLAFAILNGLTPPDVSVSLYDDRIEEINYDEDTDLVAMSVETFTARRAYAIAKKYRDKGVPVIMGGYHPTILPEEVSEFADSVVVGDAEGVWETILQDAKNKKLKKIYKQSPQKDLAGINFSRSIFKGKKYNPILPVQYGRGCKFNCDFCSIKAFYGNTMIQRPIDEVIKEIASLDKKYLFITDDNIFVNKEKAKALFTAMIPLKKKWVCQVSIDVANDPDLLKLMSKSGCTAAIIGFESLEKRNLELMNKKINIKFNDYPSMAKKFQDQGIMIYGTFVIGYDYDTIDAFDMTLDFAMKSKFVIANFNSLMAMPGTALYARLKKEGRLIFDKWWIDPNFRWGEAMLIPKNMTPEQLNEGCYKIRLEFNSYKGILKRSLDFNANSNGFRNFTLFMIANIISRKEILRKQSLELGV